MCVCVCAQVTVYRNFSAQSFRNIFLNNISASRVKPCAVHIKRLTCVSSICNVCKNNNVLYYIGTGTCTASAIRRKQWLRTCIILYT